MQVEYVKGSAYFDLDLGFLVLADGAARQCLITQDALGHLCGADPPIYIPFGIRAMGSFEMHLEEILDIVRWKIQQGLPEGEVVRIETADFEVAP